MWSCWHALEIGGTNKRRKLIVRFVKDLKKESGLGVGSSQLAKYLLHKHENLSSDAQRSRKSQAYTCKSSAGG